MNHKKMALTIGIGGVIIALVVGSLVIYRLYYAHQPTNTGLYGNQVVTSDQFAEHTTPQSCWIALGGNVYDATSLIADNPTFSTQIAALCGKDGSAVFTVQKYHQQDLDEATITTLRETLVQRRVGMLVP